MSVPRYNVFAALQNIVVSAVHALVPPMFHDCVIVQKYGPAKLPRWKMIGYIKTVNPDILWCLLCKP
jgi:hypothetical protein